ncbi:MAG: glycosyltransferase family 39 protein [Candidatus Moraniibacteriota bacterium]
MQKKLQLFKNYLFQNKLRASLILLLLIVVVGGSLRFYNLGKNSFIADEYLDMNSAYAYRMTHVWQAWDFNNGQPKTSDVNQARDVRAWIYKWQVAQVFKLLPPTEEVARLVSVFWGLVSIVLIYAVATSFSKKRQIGLLAAFLFAISAMGIMFDRKLRMYAMFYPMYLTLSWTLFLAFERAYDGRNWFLARLQRYSGINMLYGFLALVFGFVSLELQLLTVNIVAAFFGFVFVQTILQWKNEKKLTLNKYSFLTSVMIFGGVIAIKFFPGITGIFVASIKCFINNGGYFEKILSDYSNWMFGVLLFFLGGYFLYKQTGQKKEAVWLLTSLLVPLFMAAFMWKRTQGIQYIFFLQSFLIILIASGIYAVATFFEKQLVNISKKAFWVTIFLALLLLPNYAYFFSENNTYHRTDVGDYRKVFLYVKKYFKAGDVIVTRNFRNYYLSGMHTKIYDFGGESALSDLSVEQLKQVAAQNSSGWIILFDNDTLFFSKEAKTYLENNFSKVDNAAVRGQATVYFWRR